MSSGSHLLVAAFDFGTTYSGYAFSFQHEPLQITLNQNWVAGTDRLISLKTPTCILLDPEEKFHSFGFDAENKYCALAEDGDHQDWLFFRRFKMLLHNNQKLSRKTTLQDITGKRLFALDIFSLSIRYLRSHLLCEIKKKIIDIDESDIKYVITIPAIWDDSGKQFMRMAALQAGIETRRLKLVLEPEAASIWCQTLTAKANDSLSKPGAQYMVVDLGGGTADIVVHEKGEDGTLKELHKASGGPWGGMYVDINFTSWLETLLGHNTMERFKKEGLPDYFDILREFESNKRSMRSDAQEYMTIKIPSILRELSEEENGDTFENQVGSSSFSSSIVIRRDKMRIKTPVVQGWFDGPTDNIISHIERILGDPNMKGVLSVLLVGAFGESIYVQERIRNAISNKRLIVPEDAGLAVLKGAVRCGHQPSLLSARVMKYSYGLGTFYTFDESKDDASKLVFKNGEKMVCNRFLPFIRAGEIVPIGRKCKTKLIPTCMDKSWLPVYCSPDSNPSYTTDKGCEYVGSLIVYHPEGDTLADKRFIATMIFEDTEIKIKARIQKSGKECRTELDWLHN